MAQVVELVVVMAEECDAAVGEGEPFQ